MTAKTANTIETSTRVAFGDVVRQVKDKVDPEESGLERYVAGEHMDTDDLRIRRWGDIGDGYLGPAFHMRFKPGHVLYGSRRTYLRKVALADFEGITANTTYVLESRNPEVLHPELLPFIMQTEAFHKHSIQESRGSVNPYVNFSDLATFEFALPPMEEQRRLVEVLRAINSALDSQLRLRTNALEMLESAALELLRQDLLSPLHANPGMKMPNGFEVATIGSVCDRITYGFTNPMPTTQIGPWMVTATDLRDGAIDYNKARHTSQSAFDNDLTEKSRVRIGDVLLTKDGTLGRVALVDRDSVCINQSVAVLRPNKRILPEFLAWTLRCPPMQSRLMLDSGGSAVKHLYITKVGDTHFPLPGIDIQRGAVETLNALQSVLEQSKQRDMQLQQLSLQIMSKLNLS